MIPAAALAAVPGAGPGEAAPRIEPLAGGVVNRAFRVDTRAGRYVLRLNADAPTARALGVDRVAEVAAQRLAAAAGLAPRVVASDPDHAYLITEFVDGGTLAPAAIAQPETMRRLGATLARLRELPVGTPPGAAAASRGAPPAAPVAALPCGPSLIERTRERIAHASERADAPGRAALARALDAAERGWAAAGTARRRPCLVHSDPNPGNVMGLPGGGALLLLDWEYAHVGDPLQDPASWLQACPELRGQQVPLLRACGLGDVADAAMLDGMVAVYEALARAWHGLVDTAAGIPPGRRAN